MCAATPSLHPAVPESLARTFRGLTEPRVLDHIRSLGVTAVELLPVHTFVNDSYLLDKGLTNYWGYNTISFFAPARRYAHVPDFAFSEFKEMVARFHDAGIEVILDVVYNHTAEGNQLGPTLVVQGHRQRVLLPAAAGRSAPLHQRYRHRQHASICRISACCRWSPTRCAIGCRRCMSTAFASTSAPFSRASTHGFDQGGGFLDSCGQDPVLSSVKLIAEPWDFGPGGYQVGAFPPGWAEWNDRYRDTVRSYWKGDDGKLADFAARIVRLRPIFSTAAAASRGRASISSPRMTVSR